MWFIEVTGHFIAISNSIQNITILVTEAKNDSNKSLLVQQKNFLCTSKLKIFVCLFFAWVSWFPYYLLYFLFKVFPVGFIFSHRFICQFLEKFIFSYSIPLFFLKCNTSCFLYCVLILARRSSIFPVTSTMI